MNYPLIAYWNLAAEAPPITALRWDWNITTLTNDTGAGTETWVDQDLTDGQANDIVLNWDYTPVSPAPAASLVLGDWLVGHPRAYENFANDATDLLYGSVVTPVGVKDFEATMQCRIIGAADTGETAFFTLFQIQCFDERDLYLRMSLDDAGNCLAWISLGNDVYGLTVGIATSSIVDIGVLVTADGLLNTDISLLVNGITEDTFNVLNADIGTGVREQISGRARIGINDTSSAYQSGVSLNVFRYQLATL